MLVLARQHQQEVVITVPPSADPRQIVVSVQGIGETNVRLGFDAEPCVTIDRREVHNAKKPTTKPEGGAK